MSRPVTRLNRAREGGYAIERELGGNGWIQKLSPLLLVFALGLAACGGQTVGGEGEGSGTLSLEVSLWKTQRTA